MIRNVSSGAVPNARPGPQSPYHFANRPQNFYNRANMWTLRALIVICLYLGLRGLGIAWTTLSQLELYRASDAAGPPMLRITINAALGASFCALAVKLHRRNRRALHALPALVMIHALFAYFWLASYAQTAFDRGRLDFAAVTSALGVGFVLWLWLRLRRKLRRTS